MHVIGIEEYKSYVRASEHNTLLKKQTTNYYTLTSLISQQRNTHSSSTDRCLLAKSIRIVQIQLLQPIETRVSVPNSFFETKY
jgi:hypothetical protein